MLRLFEVLVFKAQKGDFPFQNIVKDIFLVLIGLKRKVGKMAIFGPKPWVNPFGKMSIFRLFEVPVFIVQKGNFSFQNIVKDIFLAYIGLKKRLEKWRLLDENHGLTPLKKCQFFPVFEVFVFIAQKDNFSFWNIVKKIFLDYIS